MMCSHAQSIDIGINRCVNLTDDRSFIHHLRLGLVPHPLRYFKILWIPKMIIFMKTGSCTAPYMNECKLCRLIVRQAIYPHILAKKADMNGNLKYIFRSLSYIFNLPFHSKFLWWHFMLCYQHTYNLNNVMIIEWYYRVIICIFYVWMKLTAMNSKRAF